MNDSIRNHPIKVGLLPSGIRYLLVKTDSDNKVSVQIRVNVGSRDEEPRIKGISHLLEHMFFQGSESYPTSKKLEREIYRCGGNFNAYTDYDETVFHTEGFSKCVDTIAKIMADSFYRSRFLAKNFANEQKIVINELNDVYSKPQDMVVLELLRTAFEGTRLEEDVGGTPETVKSITVDDIKNFVNTYYQRNVIVTIAGDVSLKHCEALVKRLFSKTAHYPVKRNTAICDDSERILYKDFPFRQTGMKIHHIPDKSEQCFVAIGFPSYAYADTTKTYQMLLVREILTGYMNSRLYTLLRQREGLVYHVDSGNSFYEDFGYYTIRCTTSNNRRTLRKCVTLILQEVCLLSQKLTKNQFSDSKEHLLKSLVLEADNCHSVGLEYSQDLYHYGKVLPIKEKLAIVRKISLADIRGVAKEVFQPERATICYSGTSVYL